MNRLTLDTAENVEAVVSVSDVKHYLDCICTFDIESSRLPDIEQAVMYIWQFNINDQVTVIGRTWPDFFDMLQKIKGVIGNYWLVLYVHTKFSGQNHVRFLSVKCSTVLSSDAHIS